MYGVTRRDGEWRHQRSGDRVPPLCCFLIICCIFLVSYVEFLRRTRAAVVIQQYVRMWVARTRYQKQRSAAITIQCFLRAYMARQQYYKVCDVM